MVKSVLTAWMSTSKDAFNELIEKLPFSDPKSRIIESDETVEIRLSSQKESQAGEKKDSSSPE